MPKVYITNYCGLDYSKAEKYGNLISITSGVVDFSDMDKVRNSIREKLDDFTADDYLLFSGPTIISILSVVECINRLDRYEAHITIRVNGLVWINKNQDYTEIKL